MMRFGSEVILPENAACTGQTLEISACGALATGFASLIREAAPH